MEVTSGYKRSPWVAANHSRLALDAVMTQRILDERDVQEILEDLREQLNRAYFVVDSVETEGKKYPLHARIIDLETRLVSDRKSVV